MTGESGEALSEREIEILRLVATGVTNREIALRLVISPNTVKVHLRNIFAKLGVESRTEATLVAIQNGWVDVGAVPEATLAPTAPQLPAFSWPRRIFLVSALAVCLLLALWPRSAAQTAERPSDLSDNEAMVSSSSAPDTAQRWYARASLQVARQRFAAATLGGLVYTIGGELPQGVTGDVEAYDPGSDTWERRTAKPTAAANVAAVALGNELFVPGGSDTDWRVFDVLEIYNPAADTWRSGHKLPAPRCGYALAACNGKLFLFGGTDGTRYVDDVLIYDVQSDNWSQGTPMAQARGFAGAVAVDGKIYVVGGYDGTSEYATCELYDPALEGSGRSPWEPLASMTLARGGLGLATAGGRLYAVGGGWNGRLAYNESYDIASDRWQSFPTPILGQWRTLGLAAVQGTLGTTLYALGGWTGTSVAVNQAYRASVSVYLPGVR